MAVRVPLPASPASPPSDPGDRNAPVDPAEGAGSPAPLMPDGWEAIAAQADRNRDYRGLLDEVAVTLGREAYTADDGVVHPEPLRAKVPELVRALAARAERGKGDYEVWLTGAERERDAQRARAEKAEAGYAQAIRDLAQARAQRDFARLAIDSGTPRAEAPVVPDCPAGWVDVRIVVAVDSDGNAGAAVADPALADDNAALAAARGQLPTTETPRSTLVWVRVPRPPPELVVVDLRAVRT